MFYLITGKDFKKRLAKKNQLLRALHKKRAGSEVFSLEPDGFEEGTLEELLSSQGLFESKHIVVGDGLFRDAETKEVMMKYLEDLKNSPNVFLFLEEKLNKKPLEKISEYAQEVFLVGDGGEKNEIKPNHFTLADALGGRDKSGLWVEYQKALKEGALPEALHGILFWQVKTIILTKRAKSAGEAGVSPFPFQKAQRFAKNFKDGELENISARLVCLYHDAHRGKIDLREGLETFILTF